MSFVVVASHRFWWPVTVRKPSQEAAGQQVEATFQMEFDALPTERAREIDDARNALPAEQRAARVHDWLYEVARNWRDVVDQDGQPLPFDREAFDGFLQLAFHRNAVIDAYAEAMSGQAARLGNSAGRRGH